MSPRSCRLAHTACSEVALLAMHEEFNLVPVKSEDKGKKAKIRQWASRQKDLQRAQLHREKMPPE